MTTRPQGYEREFDVFNPATWVIESLSRKEFDAYCSAWLKERVEDVIERSEARTRVEKGMQSTDVARLATTLLQATVILTIAKNKHDIPHERTSLFTKYVEVIFEREKSKSDLVKQYEQELHRLHELAGYTLHKTMESGSAGCISDAGFRSLVREVWDAHSGSKPLPQGVKPVLDSIVDAAQNRLVFLRGEGESQSDFGFLLSSFREYFAAAFFRNDECADRDRVFETLLTHVSHWENVLLFYSGFQDASDQRRWINHLDKMSEYSTDMLFEAVRFRRTLLKMLPEFRDIQKKTFRNALQQVLSPDTLWSWSNQEWASDILRTLRGGTEIEFVLDLLYKHALDDRDTFAAALELAARISPRSGDAWRTLISKLEVHSLGQFSDVVFKIAIDYEIPISAISKLNAADLGRLLSTRRHYARLREEIASLPDPAEVCNLLATSWTLAQHSLEAHHCIKTINSILKDPELARTRRVHVLAPLSFFSQSPKFFAVADVRAMAREIQLDGSRLGDHLLALAEAMEEPTNTLADQRARSTQDAIAVRCSPELDCNRLLGPSVNLFAAHNLWQEFKVKLVECRQHPDWGAIAPRYLGAIFVSC